MLGGSLLMARLAAAYVEVSATTGNPTITTDGDYKVYKWTSGVGSITFSNGGLVEYLVVGGGGATGHVWGTALCLPGAAAGEYKAGSYTVAAQQYSIAVGTGGVAGTSVGNRGGNGSDSSFATVTALGGQGARGSDQMASGGYGTTSSAVQWYPGAALGGSNGQNSTTGNANGGQGISNSITGTAVLYAGGGAAAPNGTANGGGGNGGNNTAGVAGTANTGGAAGGSSRSSDANANGATGGSGVVILRFKFQN